MQSVHLFTSRHVRLTVSVVAIFGAALLLTVSGVFKGGSARTPKLLVGSSASTPKLFFSGNWETGDLSQWTWGAQCPNVNGYVPPPGSGNVGTVSVVTDVVAQGKYAARFDLPAYPSNNSCEVLRKRTMALGTDDWYAQEVYFPADWREPSNWGLALGQYDFQGITGPPVGLDAHSNHVDVGIETGFCPGKNEGCQYNLVRPIAPLGTSLAGTWQQFIVHVHHAADSSGLVQGWWRPRGGTWAETVTWHGVTVQWREGETPNTNSPTADKIGAYRGGDHFPISIWQDGFCVATSFAAAESCL